MTQFPQLLNLFLAYFPEDWPAISGSPAGAVEDFRSHKPSAVVAAVRAEITRLLDADVTEIELRDLLAEVSSYGPWLTGEGTARDWLASIRASLDERDFQIE